MPQKRYHPEVIMTKLRGVLRCRGKKVPEVVKTIGISEVSQAHYDQQLVLGCSRQSGRYVVALAATA